MLQQKFLRAAAKGFFSDLFMSGSFLMPLYRGDVNICGSINLFSLSLVVVMFGAASKEDNCFEAVLFSILVGCGGLW